MAKKTSKRAPRTKPAARRKAPGGSVRKKTTARKTTKKKTSRAKSPVKKPANSSVKKPSSKSSKKKSSKKKTAKGKTSRKTIPKKKTTTKKKTTKKKTAAKANAAKTAGGNESTAKTSTADKSASAAGKSAAGKSAANKSAAKSTPKKSAAKDDGKTAKKKRSGRRSLGARSVAEAASAGMADAQGYVYVNGRRVRMISTKGQGLVKKSRTNNAAKAPEAEPEGPKKPLKTTLTAKQLRNYRDVLLIKRAELVGDVSAMETAALQSRGGNLSNLPIHMADIGSDTYDQDFMLSLAETERKRLREIDDALMRIKDKTYGICQMTGQPIPTARLDAKPWAKYTIEAARAVEAREWRPS